MISLSPTDDHLDGLLGVAFEGAAGAIYRLERRLGSGGMGSAFLATRWKSGGQGQVVVKVIHPSFVLGSEAKARTSMQKEVVALRRLSSRVPPTPHVVRYFETGALAVQFGTHSLQLPWLSLEYVHGGAEGTTLTERVDRSVSTTGHAFDAARAIRAIECIAAGLSAVHDQGVIHRDLKPDNILCCGFGDDELFKITDFGIARPLGIALTFGNCVVGTPGYAPPEQCSASGKLGAWSDVFSLAALTYFVLTGEEFFRGSNVHGVMAAVVTGARRSIADSPTLCPELASRPTAISAIDLALSRATSLAAEQRPPTAEQFAASVVSVLKIESKRSAPASNRLRPLLDTMLAETRPDGLAWSKLCAPQPGLAVRSVAFNSDGSCLVAASKGLWFWDGEQWAEAQFSGLTPESSFRFVQRLSADRWLVGGDGATLARCYADGSVDIVQGGDPSLTFTHASGDHHDLAVMVGKQQGGGFVLYSISARRWLRPLSLDNAASVISLSRIHDERWLLCGRGLDGQGYVALFSPCQFDVTLLPVPPTRAFLACAGQPDRSLGVACGADGAVVQIDDSGVHADRLPAGVDLSAAALDLTGRLWAASPGALWMRDAGRWRQVYADNELQAPFVALHADQDQVLAITADGVVLQGRMGH